MLAPRWRCTRVRAAGLRDGVGRGAVLLCGLWRQRSPLSPPQYISTRRVGAHPTSPVQARGVDGPLAALLDELP